MLCDQCGYNLSTTLKCPNCGLDNSNTDYKPVDVNLLQDPVKDFVEDALLDVDELAELALSKEDAYFEHRRFFH